MPDRPVKKLFDLLEESTTVLQKDLNTSYLEALAENLGNIVQKQVKVENERPTDQTVAALQKIYAQIQLSVYDMPTKRQALQLICLRGMQMDKVEANKQLTPDAIGYMVGYLAQALGRFDESDYHILDLAVGSGNLILTVMGQLQSAESVNIKGTGIDNDDLLLELAAVMSSWLQADLTLLHQDAVMPIMAEPADLVISDLPVGYYPVDAQAKDYETRAKQGHSYLHHLLIEQGIASLKPGSLALFVVPTAIFQSDESKGLTEWLTKAAYFQGLLNLPEKMFANAAVRKSILVLQKHGGQAKQAEQILLSDLPAFNDRSALTRFMQALQEWQQQYYQK